MLSTDNTLNIINNIISTILVDDSIELEAIIENENDNEFIYTFRGTKNPSIVDSLLHSGEQVNIDDLLIHLLDKRIISTVSNECLDLDYLGKLLDIKNKMLSLRGI